MEPVPPLQVAAQRIGCGGVQRQQPGLAELGLAHGQHAADEVEVTAVEADRLTDPHPGHREQADQRLVGGHAQRKPQAGGGRDQRRDVSAGVKVRSGPARPPWDQVRGRHLRRGVDGMQVGGEAADRREPQRMPALVPAWQRRPRQRVCGGDRLGSGVFQIGDELA